MIRPIVQKAKGWGLRALIALDAALGAMLPHGHVGQTISSRAETARQDGRAWGCILCRFLDWIEKDHCATAVINDRKRAEKILEDLEGR